MTQAQKVAKEKFKKAIEYRKKTGASLKEAFAFVYGRKVTTPKKKATPKKKIGALPIDFKGNFLGYRFKILNQYQLDGGVTAQLVELDGRGDIIAELTGSTRENDRAAAVLYSGGLATGKDLRLDEKDKKDLQKRIKSFIVGLNKEVSAYNSGKDTSRKKSKGLKIVYKPKTKKLAVVDQIKSILKSNKKILKGGYGIKAGTIREKKTASGGSQMAGLKIISGQHNVDNLNSAMRRKQMMEEILLKSKLMPLKNRSEFDRTMIKKLPSIIKNEKSLISQFKRMIK